jgi:hypothetical protein
LAPLVYIGAWLDCRRFRSETKIDLLRKKDRIIRSLTGCLAGFVVGIFAARLADIGQNVGVPR